MFESRMRAAHHMRFSSNYCMRDCITALFLMELLPSRAPLCFRLRHKGRNSKADGQGNSNKCHPAI